MFQSHHPRAMYHAVCRAISGGPIYCTDEPFEQNWDVLNRLVLQDGRILRPDVPARVTEDCLFQLQDIKPLKAFSKIGDVGLLGAWNVADIDEVSGSFKPSDVYGLKGKRFAVYEHFSGDLRVANLNEQIPLKLPRFGCALYIIAPLVQDIALIGLANKFISPGAILKSKVSKKSVEVTLRQGGHFIAHLSKVPTSVEVDDVPLAPTEYSFRDGLFEAAILKSDEPGPLQIRIAL